MLNFFVLKSVLFLNLKVCVFCLICLCTGFCVFFLRWNKIKIILKKIKRVSRATNKTSINDDLSCRMYNVA